MHAFALNLKALVVCLMSFAATVIQPAASATWCAVVLLVWCQTTLHLGCIWFLTPHPLPAVRCCSFMLTLPCCCATVSPQPGLFTPNVPQRTYFIFRQPITTSPELAQDRAACQALYAQCKAEVEDGLGYLLRMREQDPYKDLLPRLFYEATWGFKRQAPSFEP